MDLLCESSVLGFLISVGFFRILGLFYELESYSVFVLWLCSCCAVWLVVVSGWPSCFSEDSLSSIVLFLFYNKFFCFL